MYTVKQLLTLEQMACIGKLMINCLKDHIINERKIISNPYLFRNFHEKNTKEVPTVLGTFAV